jgi:hypothetical protein
MRKLVPAGLVGLVVAAGAAVALAATWPTVTVKPTVSSTKAGTKAHPKGVTLKTAFTWQKLGVASQPIVTSFVVKFPKGSLWQGAKYPTCSVSTLNKKGPSGCPSGSVVGSGSGTAYAAGTTLTHPKITVVNGGAKTIFFYTVLNNPARVREPVIGHISSASGKYAYTLSTTVPKNLQIVAGTPIELTNLSVTVGHASLLATTGCPGGKWPYAVTTKYLDPNTGATGSAGFNATVHCS